MLVSAGSSARTRRRRPARARSRAVDVVELHDAWSSRRDRPAARGSRSLEPRRRAGVEHEERLVDGAVIAVVEDEDLRAPGELPGKPDGERLASVAVSAKLPERQAEPPAQLVADPAASSVGSIVVDAAELAIRGVRDRRRTAAGEWPVIAPVSPRQKSTYVCPSTSVSRARGPATNTGKPPGTSRIQFIGTPPSRCPPAALQRRPRPRKISRVRAPLPLDQPREPLPVNAHRVPRLPP